MSYVRFTVYTMSLREQLGASTAYDACVHEPSASSPTKCKFEVMPFSDRECRDDFSI